MSSASLISLRAPEIPWKDRRGPILVGKDILEILSSAMYVDPLAIYREYLQNAADSIDQAHRTGVLKPTEDGKVEIDVDVEQRRVRVRDNGTGIEGNRFEAKMTAFGASDKRTTNARGFRGVGRLSGLGYCQELVFRSRFSEEDYVSELRWDCKKAKAILHVADPSCDLASVVEQSTQVRRINGKECPEHFFEVELRGMSRLRGDWLLNPAAIEDYLSQVGPLAFDPQFRFGDEITSLLNEHVPQTSVSLSIGPQHVCTFRPHRNSFQIPGGVDTFQELERVRIPGLDGGVAAVGWILHHGYKGAVPKSNLKGLRLRSGNMQVGGNGILEDIFTETRFNSWCVGEIHVVDKRILPNGRRDQYEPNAHYYNLVNHLSPIAREISSRCRTSSMKRNWLRQFELHKFAISDRTSIIRQGTVNSAQRTRLQASIAESLDAMRKIASKEALACEAKSSLRPTIKRIERSLSKLATSRFLAKPLAAIPSHKRRIYEHLFGLIYECSPNQVVAKSLVDKVLAKLRTR